MDSPRLCVLIPTPRRTARQRSLLWGAAVLSLVGCSVVLPAVWHGLDWLHTLPRWGWLAQQLAQAPMVAWLMMWTGGTAIPLYLLALLRGGLRWRTGLPTAALMVWALVWYVHMPAPSECTALYGAGKACSLLQAAASLSLGLTVAVGLFGLCVLLLSGLGLVTRPAQQPGELDLYRYGT